jgi:hypothetical protein
LVEVIPAATPSAAPKPCASTIATAIVEAVNDTEPLPFARTSAASLRLFLKKISLGLCLLL